MMNKNKLLKSMPIFLYKLRYIIGFVLVEMAMSLYVFYMMPLYFSCNHGGEESWCGEASVSTTKRRRKRERREKAKERKRRSKPITQFPMCCVSFTHYI